jgi:hypothetical protein
VGIHKVYKSRIYDKESAELRKESNTKKDCVYMLLGPSLVRCVKQRCDEKRKAPFLVGFEMPSFIFV